MKSQNTRSVTHLHTCTHTTSNTRQDTHTTHCLSLILHEHTLIHTHTNQRTHTLTRRGMYDKLCGTPQTIEGVSEMKEYMGTLQNRIDSLSGKISQNDDHYALMETAEWQISSEQMDVRWEVYRWPNRMATEVNKQEKYMRILEVR
jgi:hypothetical protein